MTGLISLQSKGLSRVSSNTVVRKHHSSVLSLLYGPTPTSVLTTGKTIALAMQTFVGKVMSLLFNMLSRFVIVFLPRSKSLLISWMRHGWLFSQGFKRPMHSFTHFFQVSPKIAPSQKHLLRHPTYNNSPSLAFPMPLTKDFPFPLQHSPLSDLLSAYLLFTFH